MATTLGDEEVDQFKHTYTRVPLEGREEFLNENKPNFNENKPKLIFWTLKKEGVFSYDRWGEKLSTPSSMRVIATKIAYFKEFDGENYIFGLRDEIKAKIDKNDTNLYYDKNDLIVKTPDQIRREKEDEESQEITMINALRNSEKSSGGRRRRNSKKRKTKRRNFKKRRSHKRR